MLLASNAGHFSMIKALHLADLITEMNGTTSHIQLEPCLTPSSTLCEAITAKGYPRFLWLYVRAFLPSLRPRSSRRLHKYLYCVGIDTSWSVLRCYGWQGRTVEEEE